MSSALASLGQLFLIFIGILLFAYVLWRVIWFRNYGGKSRVVVDPPSNTFCYFSGDPNRQELQHSGDKPEEDLLQDQNIRHLPQLFHYHHIQA